MPLPTPRQREIIRRKIAGQSDEEAAAGLFIGERTLRRDLAALKNALGLQTGAQLLAEAVRRGWLDGEASSENLVAQPDHLVHETWPDPANL